MCKVCQYYYLYHQRFSTRICLFVCEQDISNSYGRIWTKFGGQVGYVTRTNFPFWQIQHLKKCFMWFFTIEWWCQKRYIAWHCKMLWTDWVYDEDKLIRVCWRSGSGSRSENLNIFWKCFFTNERWAQKWYTAQYLKKLSGLAKTWWMSWLGDKNKPNRLWFRSGCRSGLPVGDKT